MGSTTSYSANMEILCQHRHPLRPPLLNYKPSYLVLLEIKFRGAHYFYSSNFRVLNRGIFLLTFLLFFHWNTSCFCITEIEKSQRNKQQHNYSAYLWNAA